MNEEQQQAFRTMLTEMCSVLRAPDIASLGITHTANTIESH